MAFNGPESLRNQPCSAEMQPTRPFTEREVAQLAIYLEFERAMTAADERLITREEAVTYMNEYSSYRLQGMEDAA